jgi:hypothetical protein
MSNGCRGQFQQALAYGQCLDKAVAVQHQILLFWWPFWSTMHKWCVVTVDLDQLLAHCGHQRFQDIQLQYNRRHYQV